MKFRTNSVTSELAKSTKLHHITMMIRFSKVQFLFLGLTLCSNWSGAFIRRSSVEIRKERYQDAYYTNAKTTRDLFEEIQNPELGECRIEEPQPHELLAALHFF